MEAIREVRNYKSRKVQLTSRAVGTLALERGFVLRVLLGRDGGEGGDLMDNGGILNLLVDGFGLVDNGGFDSLALNNGLDWNNM